MHFFRTNESTGVAFSRGVSFCFGDASVLSYGDYSTVVRVLLRIGPYVLVCATWDPEDPQ